MNLRLLSFLTGVLLLHAGSKAQKNNNTITIVADLSTFLGVTQVSNYPEWMGEDTLVPYIGYKERAVMGSEYLQVSHYPTPDDPHGDTSRSHLVKRYKANTGTDRYVWKFVAPHPLEIHNKALLGNYYYMAEPGDSIFVSYDAAGMHFSGRGAQRFRLQQSIRDIWNAEPPVVTYDGYTRYYISIPQFMVLNKFLDKQINSILALLEKNKTRLTVKEREWLKAWGINGIEAMRYDAFHLIPTEPEAIERKKFNHTLNDVIATWDKTMYRKWGLWARSSKVQNIGGLSSRGYNSSFVLTEIARKNNFQAITIFKTTTASMKKEIYELIKKNYDGFIRDRLLAEFLRQEIVQEMGSDSWFAQSLIKDYYAVVKSPGYIQWMKEWEKQHKGCFSDAPVFNLKDQEGKDFLHTRILGKFAVVSFWCSGCEECKKKAPEMTLMQEQYKNDSNIVFLNVSVDTDKQAWQKSIREGVYLPKGGIHLYTGGRGRNHEMIKDFDVAAFPTTRIIDMHYMITVDKLRPHATTFSEENLSAMISSAQQRVKNEETSGLKDGPYLFRAGGDTLYSINRYNVMKEAFSGTISVPTDDTAKTMTIHLQKRIDVQPVVHQAEKMLVLSDIEGNFTAFRKLLQANKVVDENFNWSFGNGHLVFAGDMFDRGEQVTECLWLIYSLEEKAKASGGYVHFILGNHEIMNLNGQDSYIKEKYIRNYRLMGKTIKEVYGENSELGRWLRTKNIVEKINDYLFCHGGISPHVNRMNISLEEINTRSRPFYDRWETVGMSSDEDLKTLFNARKSPFWYRHYYQEDYFSKSNNELIRHATEAQIDSTFRKFGVRRIITGHTIVADTISVHFGGKVINTDVHHAGGKSEALLIEGDRFYRVNPGGGRILLFVDERRNGLAAVASK